MTGGSTGYRWPRAVQIDGTIAADLVVGNLGDQSLSQFLSRPEPAEFVRLVRAGQGIAAAQRYQQATGAPLQACWSAVQVAQRSLA